MKTTLIVRHRGSGTELTQPAEGGSMSDEDILAITPIQGPITRSRAKKLQQEVNSLLAKIDYNINEDSILPKYCTYVLLRFTHVGEAAGPKTTRYTNNNMKCTEVEASTPAAENRVNFHEPHAPPGQVS
jgi:hypothetical protein